MLRLSVLVFVLFGTATGAVAATDGRTYDSAVSCKALSLLAKNIGDEKSKAALKLIDAEIDKKIASGKTRDQAAADVEYARFDLKDTTIDPAVFDAEWTKCVALWGAKAP